MLVVDEEQHFGVGQKERLKELKANVHVLTLTATPIPRTLQLALTGVRDMSLIATPPVDRLAVRTFVTPFDGVTIREALRCKAEGKSRAILFNLCGHGHFDMQAYMDYFAHKLRDYEYPEQEVAMALAGLPSI